MKIRTLFVDLGGVVVQCSNDLTCERLARHAGKTPEEVNEAVFSNLARQFDEGLVSSREFYNLALLELGVVILEREFWDCWRNVLDADVVVVGMLREARANGMEIICASNVDPVRFEAVKVTGALEPFHGLGLSFQMRTRKPFKTFFRRLMRLTESRPAECLFVDDRMENTNAAIDFGIQSVLYTSPATLRAILRGYGTLP